MTEIQGVADCPACGQGRGELLHRIEAAPTTDVELFKNQSAAKAVPLAPIALMACTDCGFAWNGEFDPSLVVYHQGFESTQIHSPTFRASLRGLIEQLRSTLSDGGGLIVEAGCGQGELITALSDATGRRGVGVDPAYRGAEAVGNVTFRSEHFDARTLPEPVDLLVCKMTLEHLWRPIEIVEQFARALGPEGTLFIQVPRFEQAVLDSAYWDIYYEHCNYFSEASLSALCARAGLKAERLWREYDGQYVLGTFTRDARRHQVDADLSPDAYRDFADQIDASVADWQTWLAQLAASGRRTALWGGGSKAVSFMTHLGDTGGVAAAIDINPDKRGSFLPGSGLPVIAPDEAAGQAIDAVILMNPVYADEVSKMLGELGIGNGQLMHVGQPPTGSSGR